MKRIITGVLAHVDAGKTTLAESILFYSRTIRKMGRVDNKDAFLDTYSIERQRGITIFSKQAEFISGNTAVTLLDTPGHVDFAAEMERTLSVLDYAILLISGADGIQGHTKTLWRLLKEYDIPVFIFVNKMDQAGTDKEKLMDELKINLGDGCICFSDEAYEDIYDQTAMTDEKALEEYLETHNLEDDTIIRCICERKIFPVYFGSALKGDGVEKLLGGIDRYTAESEYPQTFGARVFKISRDDQGNRLTHIKVTGGTLKVRSFLGKEEKVNQIRIYNGTKYTLIDEAAAGMICAVTGPVNTKAGDGFGIEQYIVEPVLEPVLNYSVILPADLDAALFLPKIRQLEEEIPELCVEWEEKNHAILVRIMGAVQTEILERIVLDRYGVKISFGPGQVVYKETVKNIVEGVGHFEPLRHYAEVHLLIEPGEPGSGIEAASRCSEDVLDKNWQRLILTHIEEYRHIGTLTGGELTDVKITLVSGRAHEKHTEGGDFRQATYRAVRQGLMKAQMELLEPVYDFTLEIPGEYVGRAITDIQRMNGRFAPIDTSNDICVITGKAPVVSIQDYFNQVVAYSKGRGSLTLIPGGYEPCHNSEEIIETAGYEPEADVNNPTGSVFCAHGAGFYVPWNEVDNYMHLESYFKKNDREDESANTSEVVKRREALSYSIGTDEIDSIIGGLGGANHHKNTKKWKYTSKKPAYPATREFTSIKKTGEKYLLVDGYNVIYAWKELAEIAKDNIDGARGRLLDILCDYQAVTKKKIIAVFDAYMVKDHDTEYLSYHNIFVVFTKEAETADRYIERFAHENGRQYDVTVATSDGAQQVIVRGQGCSLISSREFEKEVKVTCSNNVKQYSDLIKEHNKSYLGEIMPQMEDENE